MCILMVGNPHMGFSLVGPYPSAEAANDAGEWARIKYGDGYSNDWWLFKLNAGITHLSSADDIEVARDETDLNGSAVVFSGDITGDWIFHGPFKDIEAARKWAAADGLGTDCAIELQPVEELETA